MKKLVFCLLFFVAIIDVNGQTTTQAVRDSVAKILPDGKPRAITPAAIRRAIYKAIDHADSVAGTGGGGATGPAGPIGPQGPVGPSGNGVAANWPTNALEALGYANIRCVDLIGSGDSNELKDGSGYNHGLGYALSTRFLQYASPLFAARNGLSSEGFRAAASAVTSNDTVAGFGQYFMTGKKSFAFFNGDINATNGVFLDVDSPIGVNDSLRAVYQIGVFPGGGTFRPAWRRESTPFTSLLDGPVISFDSTAIGMKYVTLSLPAGTRNFPVGAKWRRAGGTATVGKGVAMSLRIENVSRKKGFSHHSIYAEGGQSMYDMAAWYSDQSLLQLKNFYQEIRRLQIARGQKPIIVMYINSGLNDRNENLSPSKGWRASNVPDSPTAYIDNLEFIIKRIQDVWQFAGWDAKELFFLIVPSHPVSNPDEAKLIAFRQAAATLANKERVSVVDFTNIVSSDYILSQNYYLSGGSDRNHLIQAGYEDLATRLINLIPVIN